jgi:hypothetical protein
MRKGRKLLGRGLTGKIAWLGFFLGIGAGVAPAEIYNGYPGFCPCSATGGNASSFTLVFQGNLISSFDLVFTQGNQGINPFYQLDLSLHLPNTSTVTSTLIDGGTQTQVTFSNGSGPAINSSEAGDFPSPKGPHFGIQPSASDQNGPMLTAVSEDWNSLPSLPIINVTNPPLAPGKTVKYDIFFTQVTSGGNTTGGWYEVPYTGSLPQIQFSNPTATSETLSDVGYQLSPTLIPLDNLNFGTDPPPGFPGSTFTPTPQFDGTSISAGGSLTITPEPSMLLPLVGCIALLGYAARRRTANRA